MQFTIFGSVLSCFFDIKNFTHLNKLYEDSSWVFFCVTKEFASVLSMRKSDFKKLKLVILSFLPVIVSPSNKTKTGVLSNSLNIPFLHKLFENYFHLYLSLNKD